MRELCLFLVGVVVGIGIGIQIGGALATHKERSNAVEAGVARYVVDARTGATTFVYAKGESNP